MKHILDVVGDYVMLTKSGKNFFGRCPFHKEKIPSFSVSVEKQISHCFGCGVGGNADDFQREIDLIKHDKEIISCDDLHDELMELYESGKDA